MLDTSDSKNRARKRGVHRPRSLGAPVVIFDCNGVLVDSEPIAAAVAAQEFMRAGVPLSALTWLRGPKCVASSSAMDRIRASLDTTGLMRFFEPNLFSASDVAHGKPAPDLFLHAATRMNVRPQDCIVVEDSPAGVTAAAVAGMTPIGFVGGSHAVSNLSDQLMAAGARTIIADMRHLQSTIIALRGW